MEFPLKNVRICLGFGRVAGSAVSSTITKSKVSLFCFPRTCLGWMLVEFCFWVHTHTHTSISLLICSTSTCREPRLVVQVFAQALLPCQLLLAFVKRNANCTTRRCTSMCATSQCTCLAVPAALSRKAQSTDAFK